jgi:hypothetical protein
VGEKNLKKGVAKIFLWVGEKKYSLASFGSWVGLCGLQECIFLCVGCLRTYFTNASLY